jgi:hypothetical protein
MIKMLIVGAGLNSTLLFHTWIAIRMYKKAAQDALNSSFVFAT